MLESASTERSTQILRPRSEFSSYEEPGYRFPTDGDMQLAVCAALGIEPEDLKDGRRRRRVNHVIELVRYYHRAARAMGQIRGKTKRAAVAAKLWPELHYHAQARQMLLWERVAADAGLLRVCDARGDRGIAWQLLEGWEALAVGDSEALESAERRRSSAGRPTSRPARRRRESRSERHQRRVGPWCRRVGNKNESVGRLLVPARPFFTPEKITTSGLEGEPPTGVSSPSKLSKDVRARGAGPPGGGLADAPKPIGSSESPPPREPPVDGPAAVDSAPPPDSATALERLRERLVREGGGDWRGQLELLHEAGRAGWDPVAIAIVAWELLFGGRPGLSHRRRGQLERACSVLDRVEGRTGWGTDRLLSWMWAVACDLADQAEGQPVGMSPALGRHRSQPAPATLSYFVARLRAEARARRREWRASRDRAAGRSARGEQDG